MSDPLAVAPRLLGVRALLNEPQSRPPQERTGAQAPLTVQTPVPTGEFLPRTGRDSLAEGRYTRTTPPP